MEIRRITPDSTIPSNDIIFSRNIYYGDCRQIFLVSTAVPAIIDATVRGKFLIYNTPGKYMKLVYEMTEGKKLPRNVTPIYFEEMLLALRYHDRPTFRFKFARRVNPLDLALILVF